MIRWAIKVAVAYVLYYAGVLRLWQRIALRGKAVVLMYHRVLTVEERRRTASHPAILVDRDTFARQMRLLKQRFAVLSLEEFTACLDGKEPFPDSSVLITFDDGWRDNYANALPILRDYGFPAVVFLPTNYIGTRRLFWQEALGHLLLLVVETVRRSPGERARFEPLLSQAGLSAVLDLTDRRLGRAILMAVTGLKPNAREAIERLVERLAVELGVRIEELSETDRFVDWTQVEEMARTRIAFGGHGVDHLLLTQVPVEDVDREIVGSKALIDSRLKCPVPAFSYPNGYVNPDIVERVRSAGYRVAFTTCRGFVSSTDDPLTVERLNVDESVTSTAPMFLARLVGLF